MVRIVIYALLGYVSGSVLYARFWAKILKKEDITLKSGDRNPGTTNAFKYGGFLCGFLTLVCDILKGFIPVKLYLMGGDEFAIFDWRFALVLCAPVVGHVFPVFYNFSGGKGIAATFGVLLGLLPVFEPVFIMALSFIFFSLILKISPHFYRTIVSYIAALLALGVFGANKDLASVAIGFSIISIAVGYRLYKSPEERKKVRINLLWMR